MAVMVDGGGGAKQNFEGGLIKDKSGSNVQVVSDENKMSLVDRQQMVMAITLTSH